MSRFFMEKEIFETGFVFEKIVSKYIVENNIDFGFEIANNIKKLIFIASGSSFNGCQIAGKYLKDNLNLDNQCYFSSEFLLSKPTITEDENVLYVFASQSGETTDTLNALKYVNQYTSKTFAFVNNDNSSIYNLAKYNINTLAGAEKSIASTKALCAQIFCLILFGHKLKTEFIPKLFEIPNTIKIFLANYQEEKINIKSEIEKLSSILKDASSFVFLGSQNDLNISNEASLKLSETSYINAIAFPFGEFLHGHFAILNKKVPVLAITSQFFKDFELECLNRIKKSYPNALIINIANQNNVYDMADYKLIYYDCDNEICKIFIKLIIIQLFALKISTDLKHDVDNPNGLTKIVKWKNDLNF